jgi:hypothetical protein
VKYRLYVDEVGASGRRASSDPHGRYLSLTGIALELAHVESVFVPQLEQLKKSYFDGHPDDPVILHRSEIVKCAPPFEVLRDELVCRRFNQELLEHFERWSYTVFTVSVDKTAFNAAFRATRPDPYHRSLEVMTSRFAAWLVERGATGDVMAESRGGHEDQRLKESFRQVYETAQTLHPESAVASRLTSRELKVKPKQSNIGGLQLTDLIAHPALLASIDEREGNPRRDTFGGRLITLLDRDKYARDAAGQIIGTGRVWIP